MIAELERDILTRFLRKARVKYPAAWIWKICDRNYKGIPDVQFILHGTVIFIEFKRPGKKPSPKQEHTLVRLRSSGVIAEWFDSDKEAMKFIESIINKTEAGYVGGSS